MAAADRVLSVNDALRALQSIEVALDALVASAPAAVDAMGGRDALQRTCQMTCVGPVPRLTIEQWAPMAAEHGDPWRCAQDLVGKRGSRPEPRDETSSPSRGRGSSGAIFR